MWLLFLSYVSLSFASVFYLSFADSPVILAKIGKLTFMFYITHCFSKIRMSCSYHDDFEALKQRIPRICQIRA